MHLISDHDGNIWKREAEAHKKARSKAKERSKSNLARNGSSSPVCCVLVALVIITRPHKKCTSYISQHITSVISAHHAEATIHQHNFQTNIPQSHIPLSRIPVSHKSTKSALSRILLFLEWKFAKTSVISRRGETILWISWRSKA